MLHGHRCCGPVVGGERLAGRSRHQCGGRGVRYPVELFGAHPTHEYTARRSGLAVELEHVAHAESAGGGQAGDRRAEEVEQELPPDVLVSRFHDEKYALGTSGS